MESVRLTEKEKKLLNKFMKENDIKTKSEAIRQCIRRSASQIDLDNFMFDMNNKMNRLIHNQFLTKKLLEQFFVNMRFNSNTDIDSSNTLEDFNEQFDKYSNNFLN